MPNRLLVVLVAATIVGLPERSEAHDLKATVRVLPEAVVVEAGFDDDTPAEGARVVVLDASGTEAAIGKTDDKGVCRMPKLKVGKYTATVESAGHRDEVPFEVFGPEFLEAPIEYARVRPDKTIGAVAGVGALLAITIAFWWFRLRKAAS